MIITISSNNLDGCSKYTYLDKIAASEYASFIRFLVKTIRKEMPMEILNNLNDTIIKGHVKDFTIEYEENHEGEADNLIINLITLDDQETKTINMLDIGTEKVAKDTKNSPKTFYRFYLYPDSNEDGYRCTFNRRITKKESTKPQTTPQNRPKTKLQSKPRNK